MNWIILEINFFGIGNQGVEYMRLFRDFEGHFTPAIYAVFYFLWHHQLQVFISSFSVLVGAIVAFLKLL